MDISFYDFFKSRNDYAELLMELAQ
ncbi:DUF6500 family protein [Acinetobacter soli]|nr:DUF6500 family protein [Acinetobacter soli]MCF3127775.1 DUF6500 family protein [Acinetobacter soli]